MPFDSQAGFFNKAAPQVGKRAFFKIAAVGVLLVHAVMHQGAGQKAGFGDWGEDFQDPVIVSFAREYG